MKKSKDKFVLIVERKGLTHVLMSFAQVPLWKSFEEMYRQNDPLPDCYDLETCTYAKKKYPGGTIVTYEGAKEMYDKFLSSKNEQ